MNVIQRILVIGGGGAISQKKDTNQEATGNTSDDFLEALPSFTVKNVNLDFVKIYDEDSANAGPKEWSMIANLITEKHDQYDSFVVAFGMDTLTYLAAALSFALRNINKPVILTAAAESIYKVNGDARTNIEDSLLAAAKNAYQGVCICIDGCLIIGTRSHKLYNESTKYVEADINLS